MKKWKQMMLCFLVSLFCLSTLHVYANQKEKELAEWLDEEGYLTDAFLAQKSDAQLSQPEYEGRIRTLSAEEVDAYVANLNAGISTFTVTYYEKVSQVNPDTGKTLYTGIFEVNGCLAYCIERSVTTPAKNSPTGEPQAVTNESLRKVLYYGYNGPNALGYTYVETALAAGEANGDGDNSLGRKVLAAIQTYASPPGNFKVWKVETNGGRTQDLAYYTLEHEGYTQVQKSSANADVTANNDCYSLQGAVYGIYSDAACTQELCTVRTNAKGDSNTVSLFPGTYYVKELTSPPGYLLNKEVQSMSIRSYGSTIVKATDKPQTVTPGKVVQKVDAQTGEAKAQGKGSLANAEFLFCFYAGNYAQNTNPGALGVSPTRQWIFRTDAQGAIWFQTAYLKSGSPFWTNEAGEIILPLGTLTIQEIKASEGYRTNQQIYVQKIAENGNVFETVLVSEPIIELELTKYREASEIVLAGAVFVHESPDGTREEAVSDASGKLVWKGLQTGQHRIWEAQSVDGYLQNQNILVFEVAAGGEIMVLSQADEGYGAIRTSIDKDGKLLIEVENMLGKKLPETGRSTALGMTTIGTVCCILGVRKNRKKKMGGKRNEK